MSDDERQYAEWLLQAQREVDAMFPHTPPIAPRELSAAERKYIRGMQNAANDAGYAALQAAQAQQVQWLSDRQLGQFQGLGTGWLH